MFRFVSIFLVTAIAAASYFFFYAETPLPFFNQDFNSEKNNPKVSTLANPPPLEQAPPKIAEQIGTPDTQPTLQLPILTEQEQQQAQAHVNSITTPPEEPIAIKSADHFVTAEQILLLPELQKPEIVKIQSADPVVAVIVSAAKPDNTVLSVAQTNQNNANAAQSFAVKIPSFKKIVVDPKKTTEIPKADQAIITKPTILKNVISAEAVPAKEKKVLASLKNTPNKISSKTPKEINTGKVLTTVTSKTTTAITPVKVDISSPKETNTVKVLATVTGKPTTARAPVKVDISLPKVATVKLEAVPIFNKLKENSAQLSDMDVSELAKLVTAPPISTSTGNQPEPTNETSSTSVKKLTTQSSNTIAIASVKNTPPIATATSTIDTNNVKQVSIVAILKDKKPAVIKPLAIIEKQDDKTVVTQSEKNRVKLKELLSEIDSDKKRIFYLHAVDNADEQGIWGIIQKGLMGTFSKGISLEQANGTIRALIPEDADELLKSKQSSFLGKLLSYKVLTTYVYNYEQGNIGKNPDFIKPGQQLIIVTFTEQELMAVYQHFKSFQEGN